MAATLTPDERQLLAQVPTSDLAEMATELDILLDAQIDREALLAQCVEAIVERAPTHGIVLSKYDAEDVEDLPAQWREALGRVVGIKGPVTTTALLKAGDRAWKALQKSRPRSTLGMLMPLLLRPVSRFAHEREPVKST
jgi:hypothetical protein